MNQVPPDQESKANKVHLSTFRGEPSMILPPDLEDRLAAPFQFAIVGKFSKGRPTMEAIKKFIKVQNYSGACETGLLNYKHIIFTFECLEDFIRLYSRRVRFIQRLPMRVFRWTKDFHVSIEPPFAPVWFALPRLPIHLMNQEFLFSALSAVGNPLRLDSATSRWYRPSVARIQVEIDVTKALPHRLWVQKGTEGFWQDLIIEGEIPSYCQYCSHMDHQEHLCNLKFPNLGKVSKGFQDNALRKYRLPLRNDSHRQYLHQQPQNTFVHNSSKNWREKFYAEKPKIQPHHPPITQQHTGIQDLIVWDDLSEPPSSAIVAHVSPRSNGSNNFTPETHLKWPPDFDSGLSSQEIGCSTHDLAARSLAPLLQSALRSSKPSANPDSPVAMGILFYNSLTANPQKTLPLFKDGVQASEKEERYLPANRRDAAGYSSDSSLASASHSSSKAAFSSPGLVLPPAADNPSEKDGGEESDSLKGEEDGAPLFPSVPYPQAPEDPSNGES